MVELKAKMNKAGILYIPKTVREAFGLHMKIIPNAKAALFFPADTSYEDVLGSLQIIEADLEHRISMEARASAQVKEEAA